MVEDRPVFELVAGDGEGFIFHKSENLGEARKLLLGNIHRGHVIAHVADVVLDDGGLLWDAFYFPKLGVKLLEDLALALAHLKVADVVLGIVLEGIALVLGGEMDVAAKAGQQHLDLLPDVAGAEGAGEVVGGAGQDGLHLGLDVGNPGIEFVLGSVGDPEQVEEEGENHTDDDDVEFICDHGGREIVDAQKMRARNHICGEGRAPAEELARHDGDENENPERDPLAGNIVEEDIGRSGGDAEADEAGNREAERVLGGGQHGENADNAGLGVEEEAAGVGGQDREGAAEGDAEGVDEPFFPVGFKAVEVHGGLLWEVRKNRKYI